VRSWINDFVGRPDSDTGTPGFSLNRYKLRRRRPSAKPVDYSQTFSHQLTAEIQLSNKASCDPSAIHVAAFAITPDRIRSNQLDHADPAGFATIPLEAVHDHRLTQLAGVHAYDPDPFTIEYDRVAIDHPDIDARRSTTIRVCRLQPHHAGQ
jgi:hypothetical protein